MVPTTFRLRAGLHVDICRLTLVICFPECLFRVADISGTGGEGARRTAAKDGGATIGLLRDHSTGDAVS